MITHVLAFLRYIDLADPAIFAAFAQIFRFGASDKIGATALAVRA